jgi:transposase-like protein
MGIKYSYAIKSWRDNWQYLSTFFKYPPEIRRIIYTTNAIENFNRQIRKITKTKSSFPTDDSLLRVSPVFLRSHTLRKFADEKKYAVDA